MGGVRSYQTYPHPSRQQEREQTGGNRNAAGAFDARSGERKPASFRLVTAVLAGYNSSASRVKQSRHRTEPPAVIANEPLTHLTRFS